MYELEECSLLSTPYVRSMMRTLSGKGAHALIKTHPLGFPQGGKTSQC